MSRIKYDIVLDNSDKTHGIFFIQTKLEVNCSNSDKMAKRFWYECNCSPVEHVAARYSFEKEPYIFMEQLNPFFHFSA